jgi:Outer membrane protein beta-barrel domain
MRENNFEKRVREKMDQLGFDPSETVWAEVNKEINKGKKRRIPLFWIFFFSGLLMAGGAFYFIANKNTANPVTGALQQPVIIDKSINQPAIKAGEKDLRTERKGDEIKRTENSQIAQRKLHQKPADQYGSSRAADEKTDAGKQVENKEIKESGQNSVPEKAGDIVIKNYTHKPLKTETEIVGKKGLDSSSVKSIVPAAENENLKKDSASKTVVAKNKNQKTKSSAWHIGFTGGAGISNINQGLFNSDKSLSINSPASTANNPGLINNPGYSSSEITPGFSFAAGAFVQRNLSKRISLSAGLNYHYYSAKIKTGSKVNAAYYFANSTTPLYAGNNYYQNGNLQTFSEQYHLIEMPVSVNFQLNKSNRFPFIWEIGLSPGYIIGSNALYYDPNANIYIANYQQPNKMQLNGSTAVLVGFRLNKNELQIGPQLQYGLTGLLNSNDGNPGHLFYGGLKISFIPAKK